MNRSHFVAVCASIAVLATGCSRVKKIDSPMKQIGTPIDLKAPAEKARVVVVRPFRGTAWRMTYHLIENDRYIGDAFTDSAFVVDLEPGVHKLCAGNGPNVNATVAAGKTYLVRVDLTFTSAKAVPMKPNTPDFKELLADLGQIRTAELVVPFTEDALKPQEVKEQAAECASADKDLSAEEKAQQTIAENDAL